MNVDWRPTALLSALKARASLNQQIRAFMLEHGIMEVETPALSQAGTTDPTLASFHVSTHHGLRFLHTSPEYPMKRLLAAGSGDIYQLAKVWRDDERGRRHNPEFTLLEYYRVGFSYQKLMHEVADLLHLLLPQLKLAPLWLSYRESFWHYLQLDPYTSTCEQLAHCAQQHAIHFQGELNQQAWCDLLFTHGIEPHFPSDRLTFIYHYPAAQAALACLHLEEQAWVAERFEVYLGAMELGNGYQEQSDAAKNRHILQQGFQQQQGAVAIDERFLQALQQGKLPFCAGVALGVDRILLCQLNQQDLQRVISFSWEMA